MAKRGPQTGQRIADALERIAEATELLAGLRVHDAIDDFLRNGANRENKALCDQFERFLEFHACRPCVAKKAFEAAEAAKVAEEKAAE